MAVFSFTAPPVLAGQEKRESHTLSQNEIAAINTMTRLSESAGDSVLKAFFSKADLESLLNPQIPTASQMVGGLRFYPGLTRQTQPSLQVISSTEQRADLVLGTVYSVILSESDNLTVSSRVLDQAQCVAMLETYRDKVRDSQQNGSTKMPLSRTPTTDMPRNYSKVFFLRTDIENLLNSASASGVRLYEVEIDFNDGSAKVSTLAAIAVDQNGDDLDIGVLSALPCPPDCGGGGYTDDDLFVNNNDDGNPT